MTNFKILPPRTPGLGICLRHEAIRLVIARSEATWQSRSTRLDNRAVSANTQAIAGDCRVGLRPPRNDKLGSITPINLCRKYCHPARRSLSAATDAIGVYHFIDTQCELQALRRARHASPLQRTTGSPATLSTLHFPRKKSRTCVREFFSQSSIQILKLPILLSGSPLRPSGPRRAAPCPSGSASPATGSSR